MKKITPSMKKLSLWILFSLSILITFPVNAYSAEEDFLLTIQNIVQRAPDQLEFDIYLQDTDAHQPFELSFIQLGISFNLEILDGAVTSPAMTSIVPGFSELPPNMQLTNIITTSSGLIRISGKNYPGAGNGYIVAKVSPGSRIARLRITNVLPFTVGSTPELSFTPSIAVNPSYPTKIAFYLGGTTNTFLSIVVI